MKGKNEPDGTAVTGNPITEGNIPVQLMLFFFPILIGSLFQQLYNMVDAVIVGRYLGKAALGAVGGSTYMLINLIVYLFQGLANGAAVTGAQAYGAGRQERFGQVVQTAMGLSLAAGLLFTGLGIWTFPAVLKRIGTPAEVLGPATIYVTIFSAGFMPSCIYNIGAGLVRATGDSKRPLYCLIAASVVNIALDQLFIAGFQWGVAGAAWATVIAQCVSAALVLMLLTGRDKPYQFRLIGRDKPYGSRLTGRDKLCRSRLTGPDKPYRSGLGVDKEILRKILSIGIPSGVQSDLYSVANLIMQIQVNTYGTNTVAALSAYEKIDGFFWMTMTAFGTAITTFCGQNFGAGKWKRVRQGMHVCFCLAAVTAVGISAVFYCFAPHLIAWFTSDQEVIGIGAKLMMELMPFYVAYVWTEVYAGGIRGCGQSVVPMAITAVGVCLLRVIWTGVVAWADGSASMLMVGYPMTWAITSAAIMVYYWKGNWMRIPATGG